MQVPKHMNAAMVAELEQEYGSTRHEREQYAKSLMYVNGAKGSMLVGTAGIAAHFLAEKFLPFYRKGYIQGKVFIMSSAFVAGYWIWSEKALEAHMHVLGAIDDFKQEQKDIAEGYQGA